MTDVLFLGSDELADLAAPAEYVEAVRAGYESHGNRGSAEPRTKLDVLGGRGQVCEFVASEEQNVGHAGRFGGAALRGCV